MNLVESVRFAWRDLRGHPLRSALTALGVVIGVATVIALVTLSASLQAGLVGDITTDAATVNVWAGPAAGADTPGSGTRPVFTDSDVRALAAIEGVADVTPRASTGLGTVEVGGRTIAGRGAVAVEAAYFDPGDVQRGRAFHDGAPELVVNPAGLALLGEGVDVGDTVRITRSEETIEATIVGVLHGSDAQDPFDGLGEKPRIYVPMDPFYERTVALPDGTRERAYPILFVRGTDPAATDAIAERALTVLEAESDASTLLPEGYVFEAQTNAQFLDLLLELVRTLTGFVLGVAVVSLGVGSIGIANVVLASVSERTHEIGIMKAIGARERDVLLLFLVESVTLGTLGAVAGALVGLATGVVAATLIDLPVVVPWEWVGLALGMGVVVGVVAGLYPAWSAGRVDPVVALRSE
ncbi:ABC transporter permease [Halomarina litorea]|uniref:ABC transporter permease n=1 Tax=Halomarina litorea TaxID=2961595 RepID=UPI0020C1D235|nr:ABC transporter permease [Halomarina sp. BCD28]